MTIAVCFGLFLALFLAIFGFGYIKFVKPARTFYQLTKMSGPAALGAAPAHVDNTLQQTLEALGKLLPSSAGDTAFAKKELSHAGFRSENSVFVLAGSKLLTAVSLLILGWFLRDDLTGAPLIRMLIPIGAAFLGYSVPSFLLGRLIKRRREQIRFALPDALDMLVVCSEVGCALDQSIQYVSREFKSVHPALSEELSFVNMELLAGSSRADALRNFAERTGEEDVKKLVAIMIQTDRFGTSIADSLRTQSDYMRVRRRQEAEERAGKVGVKLVFPIFFCCMPSLMIVVAGPGILQLMVHFFPAMKNIH